MCGPALKFWAVPAKDRRYAVSKKNFQRRSVVGKAGLSASNNTLCFGWRANAGCLWRHVFTVVPVCATTNPGLGCWHADFIFHSGLPHEPGTGEPAPYNGGGAGTPGVACFCADRRFRLVSNDYLDGRIPIRRSDVCADYDHGDHNGCYGGRDGSRSRVLSGVALLFVDTGCLLAGMDR